MDDSEKKEVENSQKEEIKDEADKIVEVIKKEIDIFDVLKLVVPGTPLRIVIDDTLRAGEGALIVIMSPKMEELIEGGFKVNCPFTPQKLNELCKMDGAVILSEDLKKILYANVLLVPNYQIPTSETGTRHKAAERTAKQAETFVIAVSERRNKVTLYYSDTKYVLRNSEEVLRRATENLQILEKQREIYDELLTNLNILEVTGLVSVSDVCSILQRIEMINRISEMIKKSLVEVGKDGNVLKMRLRELTRNVDKTEQAIIKDYTNKYDRLKQLISQISFDDLIDTTEMSKLLFNKSGDDTIQPNGYRLLSRTNLDEADINALITNFKSLNNILNLSIEDYKNILKDGDFAQEFQKRLSNLKENIMVGKKI